MTSRIPVAVVIVTHRTREEVLAALEVLGDDLDEVVVVDTGSGDGTVGAVRSRCPHVEVLALDNVGYGAAANVGIGRTSAPFVVLANADARVTGRTARELASVLAEDDTVGAVGPRVRYPDGRHQASARRLPTTREAILHAALGWVWPTNPWTRGYRMADEPPEVARDVDWLSGCVIALRRAAFDAVGGFDPGYWMYVEDVDLGWRLRRAGWRLRYHPAAEVVHAVGASTGGRPAALVAAHARSLDRFHRRAYGRGPGRLARPAVRVGVWLWAMSVLLGRRLVGARRSSTGE